MSKKMVFKSSIDDAGSKAKVMTAVAGFGVDSIEVDTKKGTITAVGGADPVSLAKTLRKLGYKGELLSVGPAKEEEKKKDDPVVYHVIPSMPYQPYDERDYYSNGCIIL